MTDYRLGRLVQHDPRSKDFPAAVKKTAQPTSVWWKHHAKPLDQGQLGSCTGNAMEQWLATDPGYTKGFRCSEKGAVKLYSLATSLDDVPGTYPPDDTGSSGLAVAKAAQQLGLIKSYTHAFGATHALGAIQVSPFIVGSSWTESMFTPDKDGLVIPAGQVKGGHEYLCVGYDADRAAFAFQNSWGAWGVPIPQAGVKAGGFFIQVSEFAALLSQQGDVTCPVR